MAPQDSTELEVDPLGPVRVRQLTSGMGLIPVSDFHYSSIITAGTIKPEWTTILPLLVIMAACFFSIWAAPKKCFFRTNTTFISEKGLCIFMTSVFFRFPRLERSWHVSSAVRWEVEHFRAVADITQSGWPQLALYGVRSGAFGTMFLFLPENLRRPDF